MDSGNELEREMLSLKVERGREGRRERKRGGEGREGREREMKLTKPAC